MKQEQIIAIIKDRLIDFNSCNKDDACRYYAKALELVLDDIENGEK